jgi:hypothetical protein
LKDKFYQQYSTYKTANKDEKFNAMSLKLFIFKYGQNEVVYQEEFELDGDEKY